MVLTTVLRCIYVKATIVDCVSTVSLSMPMLLKLLLEMNTKRGTYISLRPKRAKRILNPFIL
ncbi:hypothetical protein AtNW77_Chr3g0173361 [Arabidopsis thaliana]|uniref:Uncharacterized protein n=1 Tax=Arabidopsis thaliana x Arabidopsis arenosa TaxID=1240361 RepID=A0A8T2EMN7_9BRAS|nr:hypothetical protein ISN45_At03g016980 [Arabidopsis thaliana x Arabidopsis arenosa]